jgi:Eco57I restriction-modification methylase
MTRVIAGVSGSLLSLDALERVIPEALRGRLGETGRDDALRHFRSWYRPIEARSGPTASARVVFDQMASPLAGQLGYRVLPLSASGPCYTAILEAGGATPAVMLVTAWGQDLTSIWRDAVRRGIECDARWCICMSGPAVRLTDSQRTYSRRFLEFDLHSAAENETTFAALWGLLRAGGLVPTATDGHSALEHAIALSEQHRVSVRDSLQRGVQEALNRLTHAFVMAKARRKTADRSSKAGEIASADESLIVIYRILFLLFAEARGLVPQWHPVFRESYTIESIRKDVEGLPRPAGLWESLQAISRLAHRGCHAGSLRVPAFNGRLFSPVHAPLSDVLSLDDGAVRQAVLALTTRTTRAAGRERIAYADLGVEQLGGVYERLLDFKLSETSTPTPQRSERRKATGSFYTPRSLTEYLVRRTLAPLVQHAAPDRILDLRIVDPAMGSGAFLVAACRYLASAYETALVREGAATVSDISESDRAGFRRAIAQRCLYGVDVNPMAVQLARLSLWLATLAAGRPLTFLDHRLRTGDSLVGASPWDILRQPPPGARTRERPAALPLFEYETFDRAIGSAVAIRTRLALEPGDTLDQVRAKEQALTHLERDDSELTRWKRVADSWCSGWFRDAASRIEFRAAFHSLTDAVLTGRSELPDKVVGRLLLESEEIAAERRFFHWIAEFPEVFHDDHGRRLAQAGFDAVLGNPPWEMLRGDLGSAETRSDARETASRVADFARGAGIYRLQSDGHVNLYQLFVERALSLLRSAGRLGLILPSGFATDYGCSPLRRALLDRTLVDTFHGFENRDGVFPIHRGLKFLLITAEMGGNTTAVPGRFGLRKPDVLDELPDTGADLAAVPLTRSFLDRLSGLHAVIPEVRTAMDLEIVTTIAFAAPPLAHEDGWKVTFGRELNATDDRKSFVEQGPGLPVIDGKHIQPFSVAPSGARYRVPLRIASRLAGARGAHRRARLAYRDVASPTNRLTLIAAIVPAGVLTTHTLFCAKEPLEEDLLWFLCGVLNSFVANYLVRLQIGTHVTASLMSRLPVPKPSRDSAAFRTIVASAKVLGKSPDDRAAQARLQACAARLYGLSHAQFAHVLDSFPLVSAEERAAALAALTI